MVTQKIYHAAIYVRLSKEDGDVAAAGKAESNSISNQKNLIKDFLKDKEDIEVVSERVDDGYSGSDFERPAFQMMLEDIKKGTVDCVVVKDLSRFGREYIDSGMYIERLFPALGVRFIAVNDGYDSLDRKDSSDDIIIPFKNLINDAYCRDISVKIRSQLEVKRRNGEFIGSFAVYGYQKKADDRHKLEIDTYAAGVVQDIFRMKLYGMSQDAIANKLNESGILPPAEYKASKGSNYQTSFKVKEKSGWTSVAVRRILTNEIYIGNLVQGRQTTPNHKVKQAYLKEESDWVRIEKNHEPVVSDRDFEVVQRLIAMDTRTAPGNGEVYPLSGLVVCGGCGMPMIRKTTKAGSKVYSYYMQSEWEQSVKEEPEQMGNREQKPEEEELYKVGSWRWDEELSLQEIPEIFHADVFAEEDIFDMGTDQINHSLTEQEQLSELIAMAGQIYGEGTDRDTDVVESEMIIQRQSVVPELPLSFTEYEKLSYREKAERFNLPAKDYDEVKKAFDAYLDRISYHYKYFGSYMDEIKALRKAVEDLYFEKAVEDVVGQIKEQGRDAGDFAMISATELANYFKGYVESLEDAAILLSGVIDKLKINIGFGEKNWILKKIYSLVCMEHVKKNEMLYFEKGR